MSSAVGTLPGVDSPSSTVDRHLTGIKVVDAFAPIPRGGSFEIVGPLGTGLSGVALEIAYRLHTRSGVEIYLAGTEGSGDRGRGSSLAVPLWRRHFADRVTAISAPHGVDVLRDLLSDGNSSADRLLMVDREWMVSVGVSRSEILGLAGVGPPPVSIGVFAPHVPGVETPYGTCDDVVTSIVGHEKLARSGMSPAISVLASRTLLPCSDAALRSRQTLQRAHEIEIYLTQGMYVNAASETAHAGTWVDSAGTNEDLELLVAEGFSDVRLYSSRLRRGVQDR